MAQLTDDCFAFSGPLLPIAEMERLIAERVRRSPKPKPWPLAAARGRVLAADVIAPIDLPPFDNSAVDGYAVRHAISSPKAETKARGRRIG
jgi:molybdopterin molybdotransferase